MKTQSTNVIKETANLKNWSSLIFNFLIYFSLVIVFINNDTFRGSFFIFYSLFLFIISLSIEQKRKFISKSLVLLIILNMFNMFIHSYTIPEKSIVLKYFNMYILSEGFIYLLSGALFLVTVIKYLSNIKLMYILFPIALFPWIKELIHPRISILLSALLSFLIYSVIKRKFKVCIFILLLLSFICIKYNSHFYCRNNQRCFVANKLVEDIKNHPIIGTGYIKTINPEYCVFKPSYGWVYRHNDFLSFAAYQGIPSLILLIIFLYSIFKIIGLNVYSFIILTFVFTCFMQATMFVDIRKALVILFITGWCIAKKLGDKNDVIGYNC